MANLKRLKVVWSGLTGLPGLSVFTCDPVLDPTGDVKDYFDDIKDYFPSPLSWSIPNSGDTFDDATGTLVGGWTGVNGGTVNATSSAPYAAGTGSYVAWGTAAIVGGRRLKGRTFLCPLNKDYFDNSGTIVNSAVTVMQTAAALLAATGVLHVWHRPSSPGGSDGSSSAVTSGTQLDRVTSLRTRRT